MFIEGLGEVVGTAPFGDKIEVVGTGQQYSVGIPAEACYLFDAKEQAFPRTAKYIRT